MHRQREQMARRRGNAHLSTLDRDPLCAFGEKGVVEDDSHRVVADAPVELHVEPDPSVSPKDVDVVAVSLRIAPAELDHLLEAPLPQCVGCGQERLSRHHQVEVHRRSKRRHRVVAIREGRTLHEHRGDAASALERVHHLGQGAPQHASVERALACKHRDPPLCILGKLEPPVMSRRHHEAEHVVVVCGCEEPRQVSGRLDGRALHVEECGQGRDLVFVGKRERSATH